MNYKMNIAYICSMKRGLPSFIYREIKELFSRGITIDIFTTKFKSGLYMPESNWRCCHYNPVVVILLQPLYLIRYFKTYLPLFLEAIQTNTIADFAIAFYYTGKMKQAQKIHCHEAIHSLFIGYYSSRILKVPLSVTIHADAFYVNPNPNFTKKALRYCQAIITVSDYNKNILIKNYGIESQKVQVIRLGVDLEKFSTNNRKSIMIVGQYCQRKGHEDLFKAYKALNRDDVDLWIVGSGNWGGSRDFVDVPALARRYGIEDNVLFFENISEKFLQFLYSHCSVFCLPSKKSADGNCEGLPVSIMEAMASKRPVVSTLHTAIPEIVKKPLVREGDWQALSQALASVLNQNEQEREKLGSENRRIIERNFSAKTNTQQLANFFMQHNRPSSLVLRPSEHILQEKGATK